MKGAENLVNMGGVGNSNIIAMKILMQQGKPDQAKSKKNSKKLCICSLTDHPGSFRCRYHRTTSTQKVNANPHHAAARESLKLRSMKPSLSRFSKASSAVESELPR